MRDRLDLKEFRNPRKRAILLENSRINKEIRKNSITKKIRICNKIQWFNRNAHVGNIFS